jgi:hypothetical protein
MWDEQRFFELETGTASSRLDWLQQQERVWFAWLCRLHDMHSGAQTPHSAAVLAIAQRRWMEARRALQRTAHQKAQDQRPTRSPDVQLSLVSGAER